MRLFYCALLAYFLLYVTIIEGRRNHRGHGGCSLQPKRGNCSKFWSYDQAAQKCQLISSGCPRKLNNYPSCEECAKRCDMLNRKKTNTSCSTNLRTTSQAKLPAQPSTQRKKQNRT
uniref:Pancreatic trypsin inhibitor n=1 Tax=Rhipicephalus zambeziensis TaxID=60191 RepID=A0A224Y2H6_9ACAR